MSNPPQNSGGTILAIEALWRREVVRFLRQPSRVVGALATPIVFWFLLGSGLNRSFTMNSAVQSQRLETAAAPDATQMQVDVMRESMDYLEYFFPGAMAMIVLFTSIFSTISIIEDRREGFLQGILVAPVHRSVIVWGKVLGSTTLALFQAALFLFLAPLAGISLSTLPFLTTIACIIPIAIGLSALGFLIAWPMESTQGFHAVMNLFLMPMWMLSGAVFPREGSASWVAWVMLANPLTYGVATLRHALYSDGAAFIGALLPMWVCLLVTIGFASVMIACCVRTVGRVP